MFFNSVSQGKQTYCLWSLHMYFVTFFVSRFYHLLIQLLHGPSIACLVIQPCLSQSDTFFPKYAIAFWTESEVTKWSGGIWY